MPARQTAETAEPPRFSGRRRSGTAAAARLDAQPRRTYLKAMAIRRILTCDNAADMAVLKSVSTPVEGVDDELRALMDDMLETMYAAPGIGLAAVQVGVARRVIVMDLGDGEPEAEPAEAAEGDEPARRPNPRYFVNPEITWRSDELFSYEEGCLSVPEYYDEVRRPARVRLSYLDYAGNRVEEEAEGLYAVCIQHEMDHLEGVLFIDRLSRLRRERALNKVRKSVRDKAA